MKYIFFTLFCIVFTAILIPAFQNSTLHAEIYVGDIYLNKISREKSLAASLEKTYQKALDAGITNFTPYSLLLIKESLEKLKDKDYEAAELMAKYAVKLSPDLPIAYSAEAKVRWNKNRLLIHQPIAGFLKSFFKGIKHMGVSPFQLFENLLVISASFLLTLSVFTLISMLKYFSLTYHDLRHIVSKAVPDKALLGIWIVLFLLPFFLGFSVFLVFIFWLLILLGYNDRKGKCVIAGLFLLFSLMPLLVSTTCFSLYVHQSNIVDLLWKANHGYCSQKDVDTLERNSLLYPDDQEILFSLGLLHKKARNHTTARRYYEKLLVINPNHYKACVNLGNVFLATEKWQMAVDKYKEAASGLPQLSAAAHFNLSSAYQQKFMFKEAEQELLEAKEIDRKKIDTQLLIYSENYNRLLIDETITRKNLWKKAYQLFSKDQKASNQLWDLVFRGIQLKHATATMLCLLLLGLIATRESKVRIAVKCKTCGKPVCKRCQRSVSGNVTCYQCLNLYKKHNNTNYSLIEKHKNKIKRHLRIYKNTGTILSIICPGACHIWRGQAIKGSIFLFLFFSLLLKIISAFSFEWPWDFTASFKMPIVILLLIFMGLFWVLSFLDALRVNNDGVVKSH